MERQHGTPGIRIEKLLRSHGFLPTSIAGRDVEHILPETTFVGLLREKRNGDLFNEMYGTETLHVGLLRLTGEDVSIYAYGQSFEFELKDLLAEACRVFEVCGEYLQCEDEERHC